METLSIKAMKYIQDFEFKGKNLSCYMELFLWGNLLHEHVIRMSLVEMFPTFNPVQIFPLLS